MYLIYIEKGKENSIGKTQRFTTKLVKISTLTILISKTSCRDAGFYRRCIESLHYLAKPLLFYLMKRNTIDFLI